MVTKDKIDELLRQNRSKSKKAEARAVAWLRDERKFKITGWHENKASNKYYDVKASKDNQKWIMEVKSGKKPSIKIENILKMIATKEINKLGLIFIPNLTDIPILFELNKMTHAALKAWIKRRDFNSKH